MNPTEIIKRATEEGLLLAISLSGNISVKGDQSTIDHWQSTIRQSKAGIIDKLRDESRSSQMVTMVRGNPGINYAIEVIDANADPVVVTISIRNLATFEMGIPQANYDAFTLLELIEKHTGDEHAND